MEQRRLRLGDILDDYCPRERRVTNHAVVAMIDEDVKQTRCTTCDAEHAYKGGKEPRRRKKDPAAVLYKEVLATMPEAIELAPVPAIAEPIAVDVAPETDHDEEDVAQSVAAEAAPEEPSSAVDEGPFHRRLIRATLPRPEGQKDVRQLPDFTIRQNGGRDGFRGMRGHGANGNGHRSQGGGRRFGGGNAPMGGRGPGRGAGRPGGFGGGNRQPQGGPAGSGRRKRSR